MWQTGKATLSFKLMSQDHNRTKQEDGDFWEGKGDQIIDYLTW